MKFALIVSIVGTMMSENLRRGSTVNSFCPSSHPCHFTYT